MSNRQLSIENNITNCVLTTSFIKVLTSPYLPFYLKKWRLRCRYGCKYRYWNPPWLACSPFPSSSFPSIFSWICYYESHVCFMLSLEIYESTVFLLLLLLMVVVVFLFVCFLGLHPRHPEVSRLGIKSELQQPAYITDIATQDPSLVCGLHHSLQLNQQTI